MGNFGIELRKYKNINGQVCERSFGEHHVWGNTYSNGMMWANICVN